MMLLFIVRSPTLPHGRCSARDHPVVCSPDRRRLSRFVLIGVGLMLLMIFRPQGIIGDRREVMLDAR